MIYELGYDVAAQTAHERLEAADFSSKTLADMDLPDVALFDNGEKPPVPAAIMGDLDSPVVLFHPAPYLTRLQDPHFLLRLKAQQTALGPEACIVGVGPYDPATNALDRAERHMVAKGDFSPLSARVLRVSDSLGLNGSQITAMYGYSMGGDIAAQTAFDMLTNPSRGNFELGALGVTEAARMVRRGAFAVVGAMNSSGKRLVENIVDSKVPALNESWDFDPNADFQTNKKAINKKVSKGAVSYTTQNISSGLAMMRGFGTNKTAEQLETMIEEISLPMMVARQRDSQVFPAEAMERLQAITDGESVLFHLENNDHSADDQIRKSAARILYFAANLLI
jgi:pimeloyl-ACP methyl ester carboxylesterase